MNLKNVRAEMARNNISAEKLAQFIGVTRPTVNNWLNGHSKIPAIEVKKMAELFGVTTDYLLDIEGCVRNGKAERTSIHPKNDGT